MPASKQRKFTKKGAAVRQRLFDATERVFLEKGYEAATQRDISAAADIEQGLLTYYFKTKKELFEKALEQRLEAAFGLQGASLQKLLVERGEQIPDIEEILTCYCDPIFDAVLAGDRGILFVILLTHARMSPESHQDLVTTAHATYMKVRNAYVRALQRVLPHASRRQIDLGFNAFESIYFSLLADRSGSTEIPLCSAPRALRNHLINFCAAGLRLTCAR